MRDRILNGKVVVVTGGAGRLGRHFCAEIAAEGAVSVVADRDLQSAAEVSARIVAQGGKSEAISLEIGDTRSVMALIERLHRDHGKIDAVVNNAYPRNANYGRKLEDVEYADFCDNVSRHLGGYFLVSQRFALYFRDQGGGNIVNMSSIYGSVAPRFEIYEGTSMTMPVEYAAIKAGVVHLTRYFAQYFKKDGVRCNALSPGGIEAGQPGPFLARYNAYSGTKGMLHPSDVTGALMFLLSDGSRFITGQDLVVDDGFTL